MVIPMPHGIELEEIGKKTLEILTYYRFKPAQFSLIYMDCDANEHCPKDMFGLLSNLNPCELEWIE